MSIQLSTLNPAQRKAVETIQRPVLILAGAGSGKTRVITYRIAYLINYIGVSPKKILALTFTNKASQEMRERVSEMLNGKNKGVTVSTFHALCVRILREYIDLLGYGKNFVIYDSADQVSVIKSIMENSGIDDLEIFDHKEAHFEVMKAKGEQIGADYFLQQKSNLRAQCLGKIYEEYHKILKGCNAIDFDDILFLTYELLQKFPEHLSDLLTRYEYVLVDEYQDTNRIQYNIVKKLVAHSRKLCVVGDDDQSIYGWRGADIRNILDFEKDYPEAEIIRLEQNYRSTPTILKAANDVIINNQQRREKELWTDNGNDTPVCWIEAQNEEEELVNSIEKMKAYKWKNNCGWNSFAFLYRSNHQSRAIEEQLREEGVPYQLIGGTKFFERKEIQDCIAYLRFVYNPQDEVALHRVINYPKRGIGHKSLMALNEARDEHEVDLFGVIQNAEQMTSLSPGVLRSIGAFCETIESGRRMLETDPFHKVFEYLFNRLDIRGELEKSEKNEKTREKKINNYYEFINTMYLYSERREGSTLKDFLEYISLFTDTDKIDEENNQVTLMTVHSSKGLEFDYVSLVGLNDEQFPNKRAVQDGSVEEERRLMYVAITRARKFLTMSMAKQRKLYGEIINNQPSRFISEIAPERFDKPPFSDQQVSPEKVEEERMNSRAEFFKRFKKK